MGRKGLKYNKLKDIIVSINNIIVNIPLNNNELIENKKEVKEALEISALEFKKMIPKIKAQRSQQAAAARKKAKNEKKDKQNLQPIDQMKIPSLPNPDNSFFSQKITEEKLTSLPTPNTTENKSLVDNETLTDSYQSQIISDWDRLWGSNNENNDHNPDYMREIPTDNTNISNIGNLGSSIFNFPL